MEEKLRQGNLFDFYGDLLKEQQRRVFEMYVCEDLSLAEIAQTEGMSRQGVHDIVRRATGRMETYEKALHLIDRFDRMRETIEEIKQLARDTSNSKMQDLAKKLLDEL